MNGNWTWYAVHWAGEGGNWAWEAGNYAWETGNYAGEAGKNAGEAGNRAWEAGKRAWEAVMTPEGEYVAEQMLRLRHKDYKAAHRAWERCRLVHRPSTPATLIRSHFSSRVFDLKSSCAM